jgi:hypothetical protein
MDHWREFSKTAGNAVRAELAVAEKVNGEVERRAGDWY